MTSHISISSEEDEAIFQSHYGSESSSPSPPPPQHNFFAPPFYNRPPTPLPPSPSLTSLLRPSRPTTPDTSENEEPKLSPVPRASPKVPTYEYYGFVLYLFSSLAFGIYLLWSYLPSPFLHVLGIYYYPNRWWSIAVPSWIVVLLVYIYIALASYNTGVLTLGPGEVGCIVDDAANVVRSDGSGSMASSWDKDGVARSGKGRRYSLRREEGDWRSVAFAGTDAVMDVPLGGVCEILYAGLDTDDDDDDDDEISVMYPLHN